MGIINRPKAKKLISDLCLKINQSPSQYHSLNNICIKNKRNLKYMSRMFKEIVGVSFTDYRINAKLEKAKNLLITTDRSINKIAEDLGYYNPSSLMKIFKKEIGITPSQYRNGKNYFSKKKALAE